MKRRESLKSMLVGSVAGGLFVSGCASTEPLVPSEEEVNQGLDGYGRTDPEKLHDQEVLAQVFLNDHELETIAVLCDLILPATAQFGSATDAEVPAFIEFIVKDMPNHQLPIRGGLAWLDHHSNAMYGLVFQKLSIEQQKSICDQIAFPGKTQPEHLAGEKLFTRIRNLTLTGYYTSEMGIKDLGYQGNRPNVWDGVPQEVLAKHNVAYEEEWLAKCIDQSKRGQLAQWDEDGNIIYS